MEGISLKRFGKALLVFFKWAFVATLAVISFFLVVGIIKEASLLKTTIALGAKLFLIFSLLIWLFGCISMIAWLTKRKGEVVISGLTMLFGFLCVVIAIGIGGGTNESRTIAGMQVDPVIHKSNPGSTNESRTIAGMQETSPRIIESKWVVAELSQMHQLHEITYYTPDDWKTADENGHNTVTYYLYEGALEPSVRVAYQPSALTMEFDVYNENDAKTLFDLAINEVGIDKASIKKRQYTEISGVPSVTVEYRKTVNGRENGFIACLLFSRENLYSIVASEPGSVSDELRKFFQRFTEMISLMDGTTPLTLAQKIDTARLDGNRVVYADLMTSDKSAERMTNQYFVATGLITRRGPLLAGRRSFDLTEQTDSGFITTTIYLSDSQLGTTDLNEGDGIEIFGFTNKEGKSVVYLAERKEIAFSMKDVIADYKQRCKTYEYKNIARDPHLYQGKMARFTGKVIQVMESGNSVVLRVNVTKSTYGYKDTVFVTYTKKSSQESRILEDDIVTLYGTLEGLKSYETIFGATVTIPAMEAKYIDIH